MKFITYPPAPERFDPLSASDRILALYGLPRRPDPIRVSVNFETQLAKNQWLIIAVDLRTCR